jgi:hypothetical protein
MSKPKFPFPAKVLRDLSTNEGDEDWLVELPPDWEEYGLPMWLLNMDAQLKPKRYPHPSRINWEVVIGSHA